MGATEAITAAILGLCEPGDEVLAFDPTYDSYGAAAKMTGARLVPVPLHPPEWVFDADELAAAVTPKTRAILVNTPHNPTGRVLNRDELQVIADLCLRHDLIAITDEVYEHLVFDGLEHIPLATLDGMSERTLTISSLGKTFSVTGWKVGWATGPASLVAGVRAAKQFMSFAGATPFQHAGAAALRLDDGWYAAFAAELQLKRDHLIAGLTQAGMQVLKPQGTYFVNADVGSDATEFARELPYRAGVVAIPTGVFSTRDLGPYLRFAFCKKPAVIDRAARSARREPRERPARELKDRLDLVAAQHEAGGLVGVRGHHPRRELRVGRARGRLRELADDGRAAGGDALVQQPRRALLRHQHEPPGVGVGAHRLQVGGERGQQVVVGVGELLERAPRLAFHERLEQAAQVFEVAVDDRARDLAPCAPRPRSRRRGSRRRRRSPSSRRAAARAVVPRSFSWLQNRSLR